MSNVSLEVTIGVDIVDLSTWWEGSIYSFCNHSFLLTNSFLIMETFVWPNYVFFPENYRAVHLINSGIPIDLS